jgi:hypothetical protein
MTKYRYIVFGLQLESTWPIPSLTPAESSFSDSPDLVITQGDVRLPAQVHDVDGIKVGIEDEKIFLDISDAGRFELTRGETIVVDAAPHAKQDEVNLYLVGSVFGALLHQRGMLPFHCNAVEVGGQAFLFCGDSGAGKSTLAAYFIDQGYRLLADDVCALRFDDEGRLVATAGAARLKLWQDTLDTFSRSSAGLRLVPWYDDKYEVPLAGPNCRDPIPVAGIYHLRRSNEKDPAGIYRINGIRAANALTANIYRRRLGDLAGAAPFYMDATARIARQVPIFTMNRNWGFTHFHEEAVAAEAHMRELTDNATSFTGRRLDSGKCHGSARA